MDIDQTEKLSQDKFESDFLTRIVRRNIKRKERERQDAREAFRQAFEVLIESQDKSAASQNAMLYELRDISEKLDYDMPRRRRRRRRRYEYESSSESSDERSEASEGDDEEDYPRPHMRIPGLITQGIADLTRRGAVGAADLARVAGVPDLTLEGARRLYNMLPQIRNRQQQPQQLQQPQQQQQQQQQQLQLQLQLQLQQPIRTNKTGKAKTTKYS